MPGPPQIAVRRLSHSYATKGAPLAVLSDLRLEVRTGEFVSLIGPSGAGKSTLLKAIGGLLEPSEGTVTIDGAPPEEAQRRKDIGFVFQDPSLLPWRTVTQNIALPLRLNGHRAGAADGSPEKLTDMVGLSEFHDYYPHELSGGMLQRVALARAMVLDPAVLLMDEPLGSLDQITRDAMRYEVTRLWERTESTVVMVTHSIPEAVAMSDRVLVMSERPGSIQAEVEVDLPRPREKSAERSQSFLEYVFQIEEMLQIGVPGRDSAVRV